MKSFLKAGVLTTAGNREGTITGTPQGGILSPLLANIALSVLDDHFVRQWQANDGEPSSSGRNADATAWRTTGSSATPTTSSSW